MSNLISPPGSFRRLTGPELRPPSIAQASDGEVVLAGHAGPGEGGRFDVLLARFRFGD